MIVVVTRLEAKGLTGVVLLGRLTLEVLGQLRTQPGCLGGRLLVEPSGAAWTVTGWADRTSLDGFRAVHAPVSARIDDVARTSATTAWTADALPSWAEVGRRWTAVPPPRRGLRLPVPPAAAPTADVPSGPARAARSAPTADGPVRAGR